MTDVAVTRSSQPAKPAARTPHRAQPLAEDVRAMSEAFARAKGDGRSPVGKLLVQGGKLQGEKKTATPLAQGASEFRAELAQAAGLRAADERGSLDRREAEQGGEHALAQLAPGQPAAAHGAAPLPAPAPHVDPAAFAQALADLWTRENGRGDKRVQVTFGAAAWPATGAELVQSADGVLDVTVAVAAGGPALPSAELKDAFAAAGLTVGRVATA
jgi:hypothetical protein